MPRKLIRALRGERREAHVRWVIRRRVKSGVSRAEFCVHESRWRASPAHLGVPFRPTSVREERAPPVPRRRCP